MVAVVLLTIAMLGFSKAFVSSMLASDTEREVRLATETARGIMESLAGAEFEQVFQLYNADPQDDPGGVGTAPGPSFDVVGLDPLSGDEDGQAGEVLLPIVEDVGGYQVREDLDLPELGLPRDLSGDGIVDDQDHSADYVILPVRIRVEWEGSGGPAQAEFHTVLMGV